MFFSGLKSWFQDVRLQGLNNAYRKKLSVLKAWYCKRKQGILGKNSLCSVGSQYEENRANKMHLYSSYRRDRRRARSYFKYRSSLVGTYRSKYK